MISGAYDRVQRARVHASLAIHGRLELRWRVLLYRNSPPGRAASAASSAAAATLGARRGPNERMRVNAQIGVERLDRRQHLRVRVRVRA